MRFSRTTQLYFLPSTVLVARMLLMTPEKGARTSVFLCCEPGVATVNGAYFDSCREAQPSAAALDDEAASRLWEVSAAMCPSVESL